MKQNVLKGFWSVVDITVLCDKFTLLVVLGDLFFQDFDLFVVLISADYSFDLLLVLLHLFKKRCIGLVIFIEFIDFIVFNELSSVRKIA